jgi:hypothetical protein
LDLFSNSLSNEVKILHDDPLVLNPQGFELSDQGFDHGGRPAEKNILVPNISFYPLIHVVSRYPFLFRRQVKLVVVTALFECPESFETAQGYFMSDIVVKARLFPASAYVKKIDQRAFPGFDQLGVQMAKAFGHLAAVQPFLGVKGHVPHAEKRGNADASTDKNAIGFTGQKRIAEMPVRPIDSHGISLFKLINGGGMIAGFLDSQFDPMVEIIAASD